MDEQTKNRIAKLKCTEFQTFMLFGWFDILVLAAFVYSIKDSSFAWATLFLGFVFFMGLISAGKYLLEALVIVNDNTIIHETREDIAYLEGRLAELQEQVEYFEERVRAFRGVKNAQASKNENEQEQRAEIDEATYKKRVDFYYFLYGLTARQLISENDWFNLPESDELYRLHERSVYRHFMKSAEMARVVQAPDVPGGRRKLLIKEFNQALDRVQEFAARELVPAISDYWLDIRQHHVKVNTSYAKTPIETNVA